MSWSTISVLTPIDDTSAGISSAIYCKALKPHFPMAQASSVNGIMPMSISKRSCISVFFDHGIKSRKSNSSCGSLLEIINKRTFPGNLASSLLSAGIIELR